MKYTKIAAAIFSIVILAGAITAVGAQGGQDDPLVTLSYLTKVVTPQMEQKVTQAVAANEAELKKQLDIAIKSYEQRIAEAMADGGNAVFASKSLKTGESHSGGVGTELLLLSGTATAQGNLLDTTAGAMVKAGDSLVVGHMYFVTDGTGGAAATAAVQLMVR